MRFENDIPKQPLFTDDFPLIKNQAELDKLIAKYPDYDTYYIASGSIADRKTKFESLWEKYWPYADVHFLSEVKKQFHQRTWEMYLGCAMLDRGVGFSSADIGPDFLIKASGKTIWIECVACEKGDIDSKDRVPDMEYGVAQSVPEEKMLLRVTSALENKHNKYKKYIEKGIIKETDVYIVAVNAGTLGYSEGAAPLILRATFAVGFPTLTWSTSEGGALGGATPKTGWSTVPKIIKEDGGEVPTTFFVSDTYSGMSAAMYCRNTVLNHPSVLGDDISLAYNPRAKNPLPEGLLDSFKYYKMDEKGDIRL